MLITIHMLSLNPAYHTKTLQRDTAQEGQICKLIEKYKTERTTGKILIYNDNMETIKLIFRIIFSVLLIALILYCNFIISGRTTAKIIYFIVSIILIIFIVKKISFSNLIIVLILWIFFNKIPYINSLLERDFQLDKGGKTSAQITNV